jgi:separase
MALSYLAGGSAAVVANLWDVTDMDIDRFSVALLEDLLEGGQRRCARVCACACMCVRERLSSCVFRLYD